MKKSEKKKRNGSHQANCAKEHRIKGTKKTIGK
jgi:hypothetical protein